MSPYLPHVKPSFNFIFPEMVLVENKKMSIGND